MAEKKKKKEKKQPDFERKPPQALELEGAVLGAMMIDPEAFGKAVELLDESCFYKEANRLIFRAMTKLFSENQRIDILTVPEKLKEMGTLDEAGGAYYVAELSEMVSSPAGVEYYSGILREKAILRSLISSSTEVIDESYKPETKAYDLLDKAQELIFELSSRKDRRGFQPLDTVMHNTMEIITKYHERKGLVTGVATGYSDLDKMTSGFQPGDFIVLAARPSMGKTALSLNIAAKVADDKIPVGFFSLEMNSQMIAYRLLCSEARIDSHKVRTGRLKDPEWTLLSRYAGKLSDIPLYIDDTSNLSVLELRSRARRLAAEKDLGLVVVDYLQIMQPPPESESQQQAIASISRQLKGLAKELNIPILVLSQLSRAVETRGGDKKPQLSDLRDSGAIEQDADMVMFIWRPAQYKTGDDDVKPDDEHHAEVIVAKQRNGPTGKVELVFNREYARFDNLDRVASEDPLDPSDIGMDDKPVY